MLIISRVGSDTSLLHTFEQRGKAIQERLHCTSWSCRNLPDSLSMLNATCFRCGDDVKHLITNPAQVFECASTFCRPIHEWAKAGRSTSVRKFKLQCSLCPWDRHVIPDNLLRYLIEFAKHVVRHTVRDCVQDVFHGHPREFWLHMQKEHKATVSCHHVLTRDRWRLDPWTSLQPSKIHDEHSKFNADF